LGTGVWDLGLGVLGLNWNLGFELGFGVSGSGFRIRGLGVRVHGN